MDAAVEQYQSHERAYQAIWNRDGKIELNNLHRPQRSGKIRNANIEMRNNLEIQPANGGYSSEPSAAGSNVQNNQFRL